MFVPYFSPFKSQARRMQGFSGEANGNNQAFLKTHPIRRLDLGLGLNELALNQIHVAAPPTGPGWVDPVCTCAETRAKAFPGELHCVPFCSAMTSFLDMEIKEMFRAWDIFA